MKHYRRFFALVLAGALLLGLAACGKPTPQGEGATLDFLEFWEGLQANWSGAQGERLELFFGKDGTSGIIHIKPTYGSGGCIAITGYRFTDEGFAPVSIESNFPNQDTPADFDPIIEFTWLDIDGDAIPELLVMHRFWGVVHAERLGYGYEALQYDPTRRCFAVIRSEYIQVTGSEENPSLTEVLFYGASKSMQEAPR